MQTKLYPGHEAPYYDAQIADWLDRFEPNPYCGGVPFDVAICIQVPGGYAMYRLIRADGLNELASLDYALKEIGLAELGRAECAAMDRRLSSAYVMPD